MVKSSLLSVLIFASTLFVNFKSNAQTILGQDSLSRVIVTTVPFLGLVPDSRASGMGDAGVATSPDANSVHWNNGKLAFIDYQVGGAASYSPWLATLINDMGLAYVSGFYKLDKVQAVAASFRYFDLGNIQFTDQLGNEIGAENPYEMAFDLTYSRKLSEYLGVGVTARFINTNLGSAISSGSGGTGNAGSSGLAIDLGVYYTKDILMNGKNANLSFGGHFSNLGTKMTYSSEDQKDFIPGNLRLGSALKLDLDLYNSLTLAVDFNKLLVPSPTADNNEPEPRFLSGTFGSFADADGGFSEEMKEITISTGLEYWYRENFSFRTGYFHESEIKGARQYITAGLGFRLNTLGFDFSYLQPLRNNHPLAETLRFTLLFNFNKSSFEG